MTTPEDDGSLGTPGSSVSTSINTRKWCSVEVAKIRALITEHGDGVLPPELLIVARQARAEASIENGSWPLWLVQGISALDFRQRLEARMSPPAPPIVVVEPDPAPLPLPTKKSR